MKRTGRRGAVAVALLMALARASLADGASTPNAEEEARRRFELGQRKYNVGEFDDAISEFKQAYELSPAPGLLFNIAQAYRAKRDRERALFFYMTYLREDPKAPERAYVEARMRELREPPPEPASPAPTATAAPGVIVGTPPPAVGHGEDPGRGLKLAGLIVAGSGLAFAGTAAYFGIKAGQASDEISGVFAMHGAWSAHDAEVYSDGQRDQTTAWVLGTVGVAAVATGALLYYFGAHEKPVSLGASVGAGGGALTLRGAF